MTNFKMSMIGWITPKDTLKIIKENTINKTYVKISPFMVFRETQSKVEAVAPWRALP